MASGVERFEKRGVYHRIPQYFMEMCGQGYAWFSVMMNPHAGILTQPSARTFSILFPALHLENTLAICEAFMRQEN